MPEPIYPHNIEVEQALLGALLTNNDAFHLVSDFLEPEHFYEPLHRQIYKITSEMIRGAKRANPITVKTFLPEDARVGNLSLSEYLARLAAEATTIVNTPDYAQSIVVLYGRREVIRIAQSTIDNAQNNEIMLSECMSENSAEMAGVEVQMTDADPIVTLGEGGNSQLAHVENAYSNQGNGVALHTGVGAIDRLTGPWFKGQLVIIAGGTKMGKTALAMQSLLGIARTHKVLLFSMEMSARELAAREFAKRTQINTMRQNTGRISDKEYEAMRQAQKELDALSNIRIIQGSGSLSKMEKIVVREKKTNGVDIVCGDHIGLYEPEKGFHTKSEWELGQITTKFMKQMCGTHDVAGLGLSQLKKNSQHAAYGANFEARLRSAFNRPKYSDCVGAIERDAHHVIMPFRAEALLDEMEPQVDTEDHLKWQEAVANERGKAKIVLALSREQRWPMVEDVLWDGKKTEFVDPIAPENSGMF